MGGSGATYFFKFSIWDTSVINTGNRLWPANPPAAFMTTVRHGVYTVNIGDLAAGYPDALTHDFNTGSDVYLQVEVSPDGALASYETLSPRQRLTAVPFARLSDAVSGLSRPSSFGTTTPIANSIVTIEATTTIAIPLSIRALAGQTANLF